MNVNVLPDGNVGRTSIYSSISNSDYGTFFYDIMGNAISYNNRVALAVGKNPLFQSFMGIRYLLVRHENAPYGYEEKEVIGDYALAENENVRPICYGVTDLLSRDAFDRLDFWDGLETISARTVVEDAGKGRDGDEEDFTGHFQRLDPREVFVPEDLGASAVDPMRGRMSFLSDCGSRCRGKFSGSDLRWSGPMARKW